MDKPNSLDSVVGTLAGTIAHKDFPTGDLAELRRMKPGASPPAYWRLLANKIDQEFRQGDFVEQAWATIIQGMAIMAPNIHAPERKLGIVLAGMDSSTTEDRFWRLLRSRDDQLHDQVRLMARFLAGKEHTVDWVSLARLLLTRDTEKLEKQCRQLARSFYFFQQPEETTEKP